MAAPVSRERKLTHMCEMMERLSIEPGGGVVPHLGLSYATALRRCEACPSKEACRDWLANVSGNRSAFLSEWRYLLRIAG